MMEETAMPPVAAAAAAAGYGRERRSRPRRSAAPYHRRPRPAVEARRQSLVNRILSGVGSWFTMGKAEGTIAPHEEQEEKEKEEEEEEEEAAGHDEESQQRRQTSVESEGDAFTRFQQQRKPSTTPMVVESKRPRDMDGGMAKTLSKSSLADEAPLLWKGRDLRQLTFGELRQACRELSLPLSHDRIDMEMALAAKLRQDHLRKLNRADSRASHHRQQSEQGLEDFMQKKARIGFSRSEFERYMRLMQDNLIDASPEDIVPSRVNDQPPQPASSSRSISRILSSSAASTPVPFSKRQRLSSRTSTGKQPYRRRAAEATAPLHLSFRPETASVRVPEPKASNATAQRILSSLDSLTSPLISSSRMQSHSKRKSRPFLPMQSSAKDAEKARLESSDNLLSNNAWTSSSPEPCSTPMPSSAVASASDFTPAKSGTPVQQSRSSPAVFKLPDVSQTHTDSAASRFGLGPVKELVANDMPPLTAAEDVAPGNSRVDRRPKRSRRAETSSGLGGSSARSPPQTLSFGDSTPSQFGVEAAAAVSEQAPALASAPTLPMLETKSISPETSTVSPAATAESSQAAASANSAQPSAAVASSPSLPLSSESAAQPLPAATSATVSTASKAETPAETPPEEQLCPVCEMGIDDVDHSDCKTEANGGDKGVVSSISSSGGTGFQFPSISFGNTVSSTAPSSSFTFGTSLASDSLAAKASLFAMPAIPAPREDSSSSSAAAAATTSAAAVAPSAVSFGAASPAGSFLAASEPSSSSASTSSSLGTFTAPAAASSSQAAAPSFTFGSSSASSTLSASAPSFSFLSSASTEPSPSSTFQFGAAPASSSSSSSSSAAPSFSFGGGASSAASLSTASSVAFPSFSFGSSSSSSSSSTPAVSSGPSSAPSFVFGSASSSAAPSFSATSTENTFKPSFEPSASTTTPSFSLTTPPTSSAATSSSTGFSFSNPPSSSFGAPHAAPSTAGFSFGSGSAAASSTTGFSFPAPTSTSSPAMFTFSNPRDTSASAAPKQANAGFAFSNQASTGMFSSQGPPPSSVFASGPPSGDAMDASFSPAQSPAAFGSAPAMPSLGFSSAIPPASSAAPLPASSSGVSGSVFNFDRPPPPPGAAAGGAVFNAGAAPAPQERGRVYVRAKRRARR